MKILIDSYGWIEYFGNGALASKYAEWVTRCNRGDCITPSIVLYEVYKRIKQEQGTRKALEAVAAIKNYTTVVDLNEKLAVDAAETALENGLGAADAVVKATADAFNAKIITSDLHFKGLPNVELIK